MAVEAPPGLRLRIRITSQRGLASAAVVLLHVLIVLALLHAVIVEPLTRQSGNPLTMVMLPRLEQPQKAAPQTVHGADTATGTISLTPPMFVNPAPPASALGLGQALFGCQPENLRNLSREQQEKCIKLSAGRYVAMKDGLPVYIKPPGPEWEDLHNSDLRARERNTADPCMAAKATGTECIHEILFGKGLW